VARKILYKPERMEDRIAHKEHIKAVLNLMLEKLEKDDDNILFHFNGEHNPTRLPDAANGMACYKEGNRRWEVVMRETYPDSHYLNK
jgi:hypothetical protein